MGIGRLHRVCAMCRDSTPLIDCPAPKMTVAGWYGEEHCVDIRVVVPNISWTADTELGQNPSPTDGENSSEEVQSVFVPCDRMFNLVARDSSTGRNNSGHVVDSPYIVRMELVGPASARVRLEAIVEGREARSRLVDDCPCLPVHACLSMIPSLCFLLYASFSILASPCLQIWARVSVLAFPCPVCKFASLHFLHVAAGLCRAPRRRGAGRSGGRCLRSLTPKPWILNPDP